MLVYSAVMDFPQRIMTLLLPTSTLHATVFGLERLTGDADIFAELAFEDAGHGASFSDLGVRLTTPDRKMGEQ